MRLLISSLDSFILLETKFSFIERLFTQQDYYSNGSINKLTDLGIIDENALVRNHIIASKYLFGGFSERLKTSTDPESEDCIAYTRQQFENTSLILEPVINISFDKGSAHTTDLTLDSIKVFNLRLTEPENAA